jgi:hypothetical protein
MFALAQPAVRNGILGAGDGRAESALETHICLQRPNGSWKKSQETAENAAFPLEDSKTQVSEDCVPGLEPGTHLLRLMLLRLRTKANFSNWTKIRGPRIKRLPCLRRRGASARAHESDRPCSSWYLRRRSRAVNGARTLREACLGQQRDFKAHQSHRATAINTMRKIQKKDLRETYKGTFASR